MQIDLLAQLTRYLKESPEGVSEMCREMEMMRDKSRAEGHAKGLAEGHAKGLAEGLAEGKLAGELKAKQENAINLHRLGMDVDFIAKAVMVNVDTVKQWITSELQ